MFTCPLGSFASGGSVLPLGKKISCPMNFPALSNQMRGANEFAEYITSNWSIRVVAMKLLFLRRPPPAVPASVRVGTAARTPEPRLDSERDHQIVTALHF